MRTFPHCVRLVAVLKSNSPGHIGLQDFWVLEAQPANNFSSCSREKRDAGACKSDLHLTVVSAGNCRNKESKPSVSQQQYDRHNPITVILCKINWTVNTNLDS